MPRRRVPRELIASRRARAAKLAKGREGLKKKARELATLCGVRVAVVCADGEGLAPPDVWESEEGVLAAYRALPAAARAAHTHRAYAETELGKEKAKLARVRQGGPAALTRWDKALHGAGPEEASRVLEAVDAALSAAEDRRRALGMPAVDDEYGALLEGVAPVSRSAPSCGGSNFVDVEGYSLHAQGHGNANGGRYEEAMWINGLQSCSAATMQHGYSFHQYPGSSAGGADMDGYQLEMAMGMNGYQLEMAAGTNGYGDTTDTRLAWDAFQPRSAGPTHTVYASQCYGGMSGYRTQHVPSNGFLLQPNLHDAVAPVGYPSLDIGLGYIDTPASHNAQGYGGGNFLNAPPAVSHADNFTNPAPAQPLAVSYGGDLMNDSGYTTQRPAQQQLHSASSSQQSGIEQLFSDLDDTQLQLWGN